MKFEARPNMSNAERDIAYLGEVRDVEAAHLVMNAHKLHPRELIRARVVIPERYFHEDTHTIDFAEIEDLDLSEEEVIQYAPFLKNLPFGPYRGRMLREMNTVPFLIDRVGAFTDLTSSDIVQLLNCGLSFKNFRGSEYPESLYSSEVEQYLRGRNRRGVLYEKSEMFNLDREDLFDEIVDKGTLLELSQVLTHDPAVASSHPDIVPRLRMSQKTEIILDFPHLFPNVDFQKLACEMVREGKGNSVASSMRRIRYPDRQQIADLLIEDGQYVVVLEYLDQFPQVDQEFLMSRLLEKGRAVLLSAYLDHFDTLDIMAAAIRIIGSGGDPRRLIDYSSGIPGFVPKVIADTQEEPARSVLVTSKPEVFQDEDWNTIGANLIEHEEYPTLASSLPLFRGLDVRTGLLLISQGYGREVAMSLDSFLEDQTESDGFIQMMLKGYPIEVLKNPIVCQRVAEREDLWDSMSGALNLDRSDFEKFFFASINASDYRAAHTLMRIVADRYSLPPETFSLLDSFTVPPVDPSQNAYRDLLRASDFSRGVPSMSQDELVTNPEVKDIGSELAKFYLDQFLQSEIDRIDYTLSHSTEDSFTGELIPHEFASARDRSRVISLSRGITERTQSTLEWLRSIGLMGIETHLEIPRESGSPVYENPVRFPKRACLSEISTRLGHAAVMFRAFHRHDWEKIAQKVREMYDDDYSDSSKAAYLVDSMVQIEHGNGLLLNHATSFLRYAGGVFDETKIQALFDFKSTASFDEMIEYTKNEGLLSENELGQYVRDMKTLKSLQGPDRSIQVETQIAGRD